MENPLEGLDSSVPNIARIYDYILGGKNNSEADRATAEQILQLIPEIGVAVTENRKFLRTAVRYLTLEAGIDQFLDIGVGLPTQGPVHEVAAEVIPAAKVAYVDYDPVVVSHASALLTDQDRAIAVLGDLRRPGELLADPDIRGHLDFRRPVAVLLMAVLHFVSDEDDPAGIIATIRDTVAPGSYLVITHIGAPAPHDVEPQDKVRGMYARAGQPVFPRTQQDADRILDGFEVIDASEVERHAFRQDRASAPPISDVGWRLVARKP
jgi:SAM-dependent methyltransferase